MGCRWASDGRLGTHIFPGFGHRDSIRKRVADECWMRRRLVSTTWTSVESGKECCLVAVA